MSADKTLATGNRDAPETAPGGRTSGETAAVSRLALAAAFGGGLGALARYAIVLGMATPYSDALSLSPTLIANVLGAALMGGFIGVFRRIDVAPALRALLVAGLCGGLTTFSTFALEAGNLVAAGRAGAALGYLVASVVLSLAGAAAGLGLAMRTLRPAAG